MRTTVLIPVFIEHDDDVDPNDVVNTVEAYIEHGSFGEGLDLALEHKAGFGDYDGHGPCLTVDFPYDVDPEFRIPFSPNAIRGWFDEIVIEADDEELAVAALDYLGGNETSSFIERAYNAIADNTPPV